MKTNMGNADRIIRIILAVVFIGLSTTGTVSGITNIVLLALAVVFLITGIVGTCPLYMPFGISTCTRK